MVKATLRAMDALTEFAAKKFPEKNYQLDYYGIAGASKVCNAPLLNTVVILNHSGRPSDNKIYFLLFACIFYF